MSGYRWYKGENVVDALEEDLHKIVGAPPKEVVVVCIGTDRVILDALGPLVGQFLVEDNCVAPVYGTVHNPVHALNLECNIEGIKDKHPDAYIIAIDACLGGIAEVGSVKVRPRPISPGKGAGKVLPKVGDTSIIAIVDEGDSDELISSRTSVRLSMIYSMAKSISKAINNYINFITMEVQ